MICTQTCLCCTQGVHICFSKRCTVYMLHVTSHYADNWTGLKSLLSFMPQLTQSSGRKTGAVKILALPKWGRGAVRPVPRFFGGFDIVYEHSPSKFDNLPLIQIHQSARTGGWGPEGGSRQFWQCQDFESVCY